MTRPATARSSIAPAVPAAVRLNVSVGRRRPPASKTRPRMRSRLPRIDPARDALTRSTNPARRATMATMSSAALPKVAFKRPPAAGPARAASASVAAPISAARGTTASAETRNTAGPGAPSQASTHEAGTATRSQRCQGIRRLEVSRLVDQHDGDVVLDGVDQAAGVTHQRLLRRGAVLERSLALRADENLEEIGRDAHGAYPRRLSAAARRRHLGRTLVCSSRNTRPPTRVSIFTRAAWPSALMVRPPAPITMPFWLARST